MTMFVQKAKEIFDIEEHEDYSPDISEMHANYIKDEEYSTSPSDCYNPDIHYPVLLVFKRKIP